MSIIMPPLLNTNQRIVKQKPAHIPIRTTLANSYTTESKYL